MERLLYSIQLSVFAVRFWLHPAKMRRLEMSDGRIALMDGRTLEKNFRQFVRGYAITSYASQGYVTISRGKKGIQIFTTDKAELRENIARSGDRPLAIDIAPVKNEEKETQRVAVQNAELLRQRIRESHRQKQSQSRGMGI
jgi:hypothetical protein